MIFRVLSGGCTKPISTLCQLSHGILHRSVHAAGPLNFIQNESVYYVNFVDCDSLHINFPMFLYSLTLFGMVLL